MDTQPKEYFFSEALLYKPFDKEEDIEKLASSSDKIKLAQLAQEICCVKAQVLQYLEDVQEAFH